MSNGSSMGWRRTIQLEAEGLCSLEIALDQSTEFPKAIETILRAARVIVTGLGKSGSVGLKVAATLCSTGTPACFLHPVDAAHGDLGMIRQEDVVLAFSWSGETPELAEIVSYTARFGIPLIAVTSNKESALGRVADTVIELPQAQEGCPLGLAPTTSSIMQLATGDCLAIALLEARGFTKERFHDLHPGGKLGAKLKRVTEIMHTQESLPLVRMGTPVKEAIVVMTAKAFGCVGICGEDGWLEGVITDGDLRRHINDENLLDRRVQDIMTRNPKIVHAGTLAAEALEIMSRHEITALFVLDGNRPTGIIHLHDLLRLGVA